MYACPAEGVVGQRSISDALLDDEIAQTESTATVVTRSSEPNKAGAPLTRHSQTKADPGATQ